MATSKTSSFWLTESTELTAVGTRVQSTIDLGAYVDVGDQQAIAIEEVGMIIQAQDTTTGFYNNSLRGAATGVTNWDQFCAGR